jgi:AAA15 family ATPase/GTPase
MFSGQLVFATHDSSLLDLQLFRRDQIVFIDKKFEGNTYLYKLSDFTGVRNDIPLDQWYLSGRFGATPVLNIFELDYEYKQAQ